MSLSFLGLLLLAPITAQPPANGVLRAGMASDSCTLRSCIYQLDHGSTNTQHGSPFGGEVCWMLMFNTTWFGSPSDQITHVGTAWGGFQPGNAVPNGTPGTVYVWDELDDDGDPRTGMMQLVIEDEIMVANVDTDIVNFIALDALANVDGVFFVGISVSNPTFFFPAPGDGGHMEGCSVGWLTGSTTPGGFDPIDLHSPSNWDLTNVGAYWLVRAASVNTRGTLFCAGDGSGSSCPCGNESPSTVFGGCSNSTGLGGALSLTGTDSVGSDDLSFIGANLIPGKAALLFVGLEALSNGDGFLFGDGLRCVGIQVVRLGLKLPNSSGRALWGPGLQSTGSWVPGDTRRFQVWYRDPVGGPCGSGFNLTNGVEIEFGI